MLLFLRECVNSQQTQKLLGNVSDVFSFFFRNLCIVFSQYSFLIQNTFFFVLLKKNQRDFQPDFF